MTRRVEYVFNGANGISTGALELDSRVVRYYEEGGGFFSNSFRTRAMAEARFEGDLRAMGKNSCYAIREVPA